MITGGGVRVKGGFSLRFEMVIGMDLCTEDNSAERKKLDSRE